MIRLYNDSFSVWGSKRVNDTSVHEYDFYALQALQDSVISNLECESMEGSKVNIAIPAGLTLTCRGSTSIQLSSGDVILFKEKRSRKN